MSQTVTKKQCTKSRLSWVHQVHTLAQPVHTSRAHCAKAGRVTSCGRPCRRPRRPYRGHVAGPTLAILWLCVAVLMRALLRAVSRTILSRKVPCHAPPASYRGPPCAVSRLSGDTTQQPSHALYRDPQGLPPAVIQFVSRLSLARPCSCHDTIDCIMTHPQPVNPSLLSRYNDCIVTYSTSQAARALPTVS